MNKKTISVSAILILIVAVITGAVLWSNNTNKQVKNEFETKVTKTISTLKSYEQYNDVPDKVWNATKKVILNTDQNQQDAFEWYFEGSLKNYKNDLKEGLVSKTKLDEKIDSKKTFLVLFSQSLCPHCNNLKKDGFEDFAKKHQKDKNVVMLNLNIDQRLWEDTKYWDKSKDDSKVKSDSKNKSLPGTPALVLYKDGKIVSNISSEKFSEVKSWLDKHDFK